MRKMHILSSLVAVSLLTASTAVAEVKVTMQEGRVSIVAKDATVRQILTEWARVGQTKIVNVERIPGGPMTLELTNVRTEEDGVVVGGYAGPVRSDLLGVGRWFLENLDKKRVSVLVQLDAFHVEKVDLSR